MAQTDVQRLLLEIDASVELLRRNLNRGEAMVGQFENKVERELERTDGHFRETGREVGRLDGQLQRLEGRFSSAGRTMRGAIAGAIAGISVQQITQLIGRSLDYAVALDTQAMALGLTTDQLQEYRFAAAQTGVDIGDLEDVIKDLSLALGEAAEGTGDKADAFRDLGIDIRDASGNIRSASDVLPELADRLNALPDGERLASGARLLGEEWGRAQPLLSRGSAGISDLTERARELGTVLTPAQIRNAARARAEWSALKQILETRLAAGVAENSDGLMALANALGTVAEKAIEAFGAIGNLIRRRGELNAMAEAAADRIGPASPGGTSLLGGLITIRPNTPRNEARRNARNAVLQGGAGQVSFQPGPVRPRRAAGAPNIRNLTDDQGNIWQPDFLSDVAGSVTNGLLSDAPDRVERVSAALTAWAVELERITADVAAAEAEAAGDREAIARAGAARIEADRRAEELRIRDNEALTEAQRAELIALNDRQAAARRALLLSRASEEAEEDRADAAREAADIARAGLEDQADTLRSSADLAVSRRERLDVERQILAIEQQIERARLEELIAAGQVADAAAARANLATRQGNARAALERDGEGPGARYLREMADDAANLQDRLEEIAVRGWRDFNSGLAEAIVNGRSLGNVLDRVLAQIIELGIQAATSQLFGGSRGKSGGGIFGALGSIFGGLFGNRDTPGIGIAIAGKREFGGPVDAGKAYLVGEREPEIFVPNVSGAIRTARQFAGTSSSATHLNLTINAPGATQETVAMIRREMAAAAPRIVEAARDATLREASRPKLR